jgi:hypothetical protein
VSTTITGRTQHSIHVIYPDTTYFVKVLGDHFIAIDHAWHLVVDLAVDRADTFSSPGWLAEGFFRRPRDPSSFERRGSSRYLPASHQLRFERMQLNSPLDITLAIEAAGSTGVTIYALHLLRAVVRDPEGIGGWINAVVKGWHKQKREADLARLDRRREAGAQGLRWPGEPEDPLEAHQRETERTDTIAAQSDETVAELLDLTPRLGDPKPVEVTIDTDSKPPEDIANALGEAG